MLCLAKRALQWNWPVLLSVYSTLDAPVSKKHCLSWSKRAPWQTAPESQKYSSLYPLHCHFLGHNPKSWWAGWEWGYLLASQELEPSLPLLTQDDGQTPHSVFLYPALLWQITLTLNFKNKRLETSSLLLPGIDQVLSSTKNYSKNRTHTTYWIFTVILQIGSHHYCYFTNENEANQKHSNLALQP